MTTFWAWLILGLCCLAWGQCPKPDGESSQAYRIGWYAVGVAALAGLVAAGLVAAAAVTR